MSIENSIVFVRVFQFFAFALIMGLFQDKENKVMAVLLVGILSEIILISIKLK